MLRHKKNVFLKKSINQLQDMQSVVWQEIEQLYQEFQKLGISEAVDYEKYYLYSLIAHSTAIEGSTLTEVETQILFDEGLTAKGKPLVYHLMNEDLKKAFELAKTDSVSLIPITSAFLQKLNATLMWVVLSILRKVISGFAVLLPVLADSHI